MSSLTQTVRKMIEQGYTNKDILETLDVKPQTVYNIRYAVNKSRGLGSIGSEAAPEAAPVVAAVEPVGTGIIARWKHPTTKSHLLGVLQGFALVVDGLLTVLTLGSCTSFFGLRVAIYRTKQLEKNYG